jgi:hypothetical protein
MVIATAIPVLLACVASGVEHSVRGRADACNRRLKPSDEWFPPLVRGK